MKRIAFILAVFLLVQILSPVCYAQRDYFDELEKLTTKQRAEAERDAKLYAILGLAIGSAVMIMLI